MAKPSHSMSPPEAITQVRQVKLTRSNLSEMLVKSIVSGFVPSQWLDVKLWLSVNTFKVAFGSVRMKHQEISQASWYFTILKKKKKMSKWLYVESLCKIWSLTAQQLWHPHCLHHPHRGTLGTCWQKSCARWMHVKPNFVACWAHSLCVLAKDLTYFEHGI